MVRSRSELSNLAPVLRRGAPEDPAFMYTLIQTAKLNNVDPQAWLADALTRIADIPQAPLGELLP